MENNQPKAYVRASTVCRRQDYPASTVKYCSSESLWWRNATSSHKPLQVSLALVNQNKPCKGITNEGIAFLWIALEVSYRKLLRKSAKLHCKEQKVIFMFLEKRCKNLTRTEIKSSNYFLFPYPELTPINKQEKSKTIREKTEHINRRKLSRVTETEKLKTSKNKKLLATKAYKPVLPVDKHSQKHVLVQVNANPCNVMLLYSLQQYLLKLHILSNYLTTPN